MSITIGAATTGPVITSPVITGPLTSGPLTSGPVTNEPATARHSRGFLGLAALLGLCAGIQGSDPAIAGMALLTSSRALHMDTATQALASSISTLMLAATVITSGLIADRMGRKRVLAVALLLAAAGDVLTALSPDPTVFLIGRAVAGVALGAVYGSAFAYLRAVAPEGKTGIAMGTFAGAAGVVPILSGFAGGLLISSDWRLAFLVVPVLSVLAFVAALVFLPSVPRVRGGSMDLLGQGLLGLGIVGVLYGFSHAPAGVTSPLTWGPLAAGVVLCVLFVLRGDRTKHSFFPMDLLRNPGFLAAACIGVAFNLFQGVAVLQVTNLWQFVNGWSTFTVALAFLPATLVSIATSTLVMGRVSIPRGILLAGIASVASCLALAGVLISGSYYAILPALILAGIGFTGLVPYGSLVLRIAPADAFGVVTSSRTSIGQFGYSVGLAGGMILIDAFANHRVSQQLIGQGLSSAQRSQAMNAVHTFSQFGIAPTGDGAGSLISLAHSAHQWAFVATMGVAAVVIAVLIGLALAAHRRWERVAALVHVP